MEFLESIEASALGVYIQEDPWGFAIMLALHSVGMAMVLGVVMITTLRALGWLKAIPLLSHANLFPAAWAGFILNLVSGIALYASHATEYTFQVVFILKLSLLAIGGILLKLMIGNARAGADPGKIKLLSGLCLGCWVGAVVTGRLMAYF